MAVANLIQLGGYEFTDQGRTWSEQREEKFVEVELANGNIVRYVKAIKHKWTLDWKWMPNAGSATYDNKNARDILWNLVQQGTTLSFVLRRNIDLTASTYTVFVDTYSEDLIRRDSGIYYYNVKLELKEQ